MPRQRSPLRDKAYKMWLASDKAMPLKEIAASLGVSEEQIRKWKSNDKWEKVTLPIGKSNVTNQKEPKKAGKKDKGETMPSDVESVMVNSELNDKQRLFCLYYIRCFNATKAYQKAYGCSYEMAASNGFRMMKNDGVRNEIIRLKQNRLNREMLTENDIFQKYMDIAFSDITNYVKFDKKGIEFLDSATVDGTLISEVSFGKVTKIKLHDSMRALDWLTNHMDMGTEEQKEKVRLLRAQVEKISTDSEVGADVAGNMQSLAEILLASRPNRNLEDFE